MKNKYRHYTSSYIMKNKYRHYTSSRIRRYTFSCIKKCLLSLYISLYNDIFVSLVHKSVFLLYDMMYNNNIYFSLYKKIYNDNICFSYT